MVKRRLAQLIIACLVVSLLMPHVALSATALAYDQHATEYQHTTEPPCTDEYTKCDCYIIVVFVFWAQAYNPQTLKGTQPDPFWGIHNMQRDRYAIAQAGNLFMYCIHNPVRWIDPSGLEIRLPWEREQRDAVLYNLRQLTRDTLSYTVSRTGIFRLSITEVDGTDDLVFGTQLIRYLVNGRHIHTIQVVSNHHSRVQPLHWRNASRSSHGARSTIYFNPTERIETVVMGDCGNTWWEDIPNFIVLGHELIHARRIDQGIHIPYLSHGGMTFHSFHHPDDGWVRGLIPWEEFHTIGIGHINSIHTPITENTLRREHNLPMRVAWDGRGSL